ncbi:MAG TPA: metallophosphoesterase [Allosphingosinicella sp.]|nr:metallophosphoesterase [Allosphingosinicella sp.]
MRRRILAVVLVLGAIGLATILYAYRTAVSDPVVRRAEFALLPPEGAEAPVRLVLISDIHVAGPDMPPARLARIVQQINALAPDAVLIAGDLVSDKRVSTRHYSLEDAISPLSGLSARLGVYAVLGNHDHWRHAGRARAALRGAGIAVLDNAAARAGPLAIGGLDDAHTGRHDLPATWAEMRAAGGVPVLLSHSPDPFPDVPDEIGLMLAGHTHCGQIRLPLIGTLSTMSAHGDRYACGIVQEGGRTLVVGAGVGTSILPLRLGAVPDIWEITLTRR